MERNRGYCVRCSRGWYPKPPKKTPGGRQQRVAKVATERATRAVARGASASPMDSPPQSQRGSSVIHRPRRIGSTAARQNPRTIATAAAPDLAARTARTVVHRPPPRITAAVAAVSGRTTTTVSDLTPLPVQQPAASLRTASINHRFERCRTETRCVHHHHSIDSSTTRGGSDNSKRFRRWFRWTGPPR